VKNPWTKKNPFLSMWLSGANAMVGSARGRATAAARRQASRMVNKGTDQMVDAWFKAWSPPARKKKR
jgi:hypothetical protein